MHEAAREKLRSLRDRIAALAPRVRLRPDMTPELTRRIHSIAGRVETMLRLVVTRAKSPDALEEAVEDAVAEATLLTHELERMLENATKAKPVARAGIERREHERHETSVTVKLLRHMVEASALDGGVLLSTETTSRQARNVSTGGIFVTLARGELPQLGVGNVVHVEVETGALRFYARAAVARRDASGVGLSWILDGDRAKRDVDSLLDALRHSADRGVSA